MTHQALVALCFAVWSLLSPAAARSPDAPAAADAIATAALEEAPRAPVFSSHAVDVVLEALYAEGESGVSVSPVPRSHDARDMVSCGMWQERCAFVRAFGLVDQAREWRRLLRAGRRLCPRSPAAPLGGSCLYGGPLAEVRVARAREVLREVLRRGLLTGPTPGP